MTETIYKGKGWRADNELDEDGVTGRVWVYKGGECLGTFEAVEEEMPQELVDAVESHYEKTWE